MNDNKQTTVWLPPELRAWLRREAFERDVTQSQIIRELLEAERAKRARANV
jgi:hypothetical protein